jgi:orotidine-5'-phosphate decarboxylase
VIIDRLIDKIKEKKNPTVLGLDTCAEYMPDELRVGIKSFKDAGKAVFEFNKNIIDNTADIIPAVKVQAAYYEMYGSYGAEAFQKTLEYAKKQGLVTIADVKRNDIASTAGAYSKAYLSHSDISGEAAFDSDFITVNPYLGSDGIIPFTDDCSKYGKGIFVLVKTSNKSSSEIQNRVLDDGTKIYELMSDYAAEWGKGLTGKYGYSSVGAVVGATQTAEAEAIRKRHKGLFFLLPGYGAQGATAKDLAVSFDADGLGAIVNNSRGIICAYKKYDGLNYYRAARKAAELMKDDLNAYLPL